MTSSAFYPKTGGFLPARLVKSTTENFASEACAQDIEEFAERSVQQALETALLKVSVGKGNLSYFILYQGKNKLGYFGDMTNLHGIRNVISTSHIGYLKRVFWLAILISCCYGAGSILQSALKLFSTGAASYSVETNYLHWDTPFPAVTICESVPENSQLSAYLKEKKKPSKLFQFYKDVSYWNVRYCKVCKVCKLNVSCKQDFEHDVMEIRRDCPELLTDCWWGGKHYKCCDIFKPMATEYGECYVFNSAIVGNTSIRTVNRKIGLPDLIFTAVKTVHVKIHAPEDMVAVTLENILPKSSEIALVTNFEAILKVVQTVNDATVLSLPPSLRGCLFKKERPELPGWPFKEFTYSACLLYCRVLAQTSFCNCTHHFLSHIFGSPACDILGLNCLDNNKERIVNYDCNCPMACDETQYSAVHKFSNRVKQTPEMLKRGSRARIRLAHLPSLRVRRLAIKDTLGLVVDIGGVGGVFFGASLLSVIELVYLFCIRRN
ncbi:sodium channel protein Nach-like [Pararge aegeria]|uniref:sodium channel protein Nach-like n=1 Tax=Pararge aegeria TaxID=116150 RepID=UPI0019D1938D|nr:sodium channel protein Nach-like [Pararge aegeria]